MSTITLPDFDEMAQLLVIRYACSMTPIEQGIAEELKAMFDQGRALGNREAICNTQEWWQEQDNDEGWIKAQDTASEPRAEILVQLYSPRSKKYYLINKESGIMSECGSITPHVGVRLVTEPTEE